MPGIVGLIRRSGPPDSLEPALVKLKHLPDYHARSTAVTPSIALGQVLRNRNHRHVDWLFDENLRIGILTYGPIIAPDPAPHRPTSDELLRRYAADGIALLDDLDGSFVIVVYDERKRRLLIANDRLGALPLYYACTDDAFCFGPEVKAVLTGLSKQPRLSQAGVVTFLATGYCLGDTTLFDDVRCLPPASILSVNVNDLTIDLRRYWTLRYEPDRALRPREAACSALAEAILDGQRTVLCDDPGRFDILLSGGMDSRGILAACERLGKLPTRALSYGLRDDIPKSDAAVARALADVFEIPFDFRRYDTTTLARNFRQWCYISEAANDNFGWCAEGVGVLTDWYDSEAAFSLVGDECWGWEGYVDNQAEARSAVLPHRMPPAARAVLQSQRLAECEDVYEREISAVAGTLNSDRWEDYKDYLYLYGRVARFIFSLGYYRELATEVRRPFLTRRVLDVVRRLPPQHRVNKNLYIETLRRFFPRAVLVPDKAVNSLPDLQYDVRTDPALRSFFQDATAPERVIAATGDLLSVDAFDKLRERFFASQAKPVSRAAATSTGIKRTFGAWRSRSRLYARLSRFARRHPSAQPFRPLDLLRRAALLAALHEQADALWRPDHP